MCTSTLCVCDSVNVLAYSTVSQEAVDAPLCHPNGGEGEKDVYLRLLKGERESTASHFASLCSLFVRVCLRAKQCVCECGCECTQ